MKVYNYYILLVAVVLLVTTTILIAVAETRLDIYYTVFIIEALLVTELYVSFNPKARRGLNFVSTTLFAGFLFVVVLQVMNLVA